MSLDWLGQRERSNRLACRRIVWWRYALLAPAANRSASSDVADPDPSHPRLVLIVKADADRPPSQIVPRLAARAVYLASESTFYRV